jgi:hypothetical protein
MKSRKEIKEEYREMKFPMGVFQVKNISNNKVLIDNSIDMNSKWNRHKTELRFGNHKNHALQQDWNEKGEDNFVFEVLSELKQEDEKNINYASELRSLQQMIIEELNISTELRY